MVKYVWFFMFAIGIVVAIFQPPVPAYTNSDGEFVYSTKEEIQSLVDSKEILPTQVTEMPRMQYMTNKVFERANVAVEMAISLIGAMALWLGLMKIAEEAGTIEMLGRKLDPIMRKLFPEIPKGHPAQGAILMNLAANVLGLDNAATPLGIKAMKELQKLNNNSEEASNAMVMFLAINTSSVQILPVTMMAIMASQGSNNPTAIIIPTLIATTISTTVAIITCKILEKNKRFARKDVIEGGATV